MSEKTVEYLREIMRVQLERYTVIIRNLRVLKRQFDELSIEAEDLIRTMELNRVIMRGFFESKHDNKEEITDIFK